MIGRVAGGVPTPWPRLRDSWWVFGLAAVALGLFTGGLLFGLRCPPRRCHTTVLDRLFDLDAIGSLPRLFTTGLFVACAAVAWWACRAVEGRQRWWWTTVAVVGVGLAVAKATSLHALLKTDTSPALTALVGSVGSVVGLSALWLAGRRWAVAAAGPVVLALACYAAVALGLDLLTGLAAAVQDHVGSLTETAATFIEELGEALSALLLLVVLRWQAAAATQAFWRAR
jgi:hypothetical protein